MRAGGLNGWGNGMADKVYDFCVIGGGSGGVRAARLAAEQGRKTILFEADRLGGTCVLRGCIPKKLLVYASHFPAQCADAAGFGWRAARPRLNWRALRRAKDKEIARLSALYEKNLRAVGVTVKHARARLAGPHSVAYESRASQKPRRTSAAGSISARHILLAPGGRPFVPDIPGCEHGMTSDEAFHLPRLPRRILIVGAGYIAVEFAGIFHGSGCEVTLLYRGEEILRGFDDSLRAHLREQLQRKGIRILLQRQLRQIDKRGRVLRAALDDGRILQTDAVMFATGRVPATEGLGLEAAGLAPKANGAIAVNKWLQTRVPHIHALGDVIARVALTPVAIEEAVCLVDTLFRKQPCAMDYALVPSAVFSQPELASVGLTEAEARAQGKSVDVLERRFVPLQQALSPRAEPMLMKMLVARQSGKILGLHMVGEGAAEMIQAFAVALGMGATKRDFDKTTALHPTAAEEWVTL